MSSPPNDQAIDYWKTFWTVSDRAAVRSNGTIYVFEPDRESLVFQTVQCGHCGAHFLRSESHVRCEKCNRPICGRIECASCTELSPEVRSHQALAG